MTEAVLPSFALALPQRLTSADVTRYWPEAGAAVDASNGVCWVDVSALDKFDSAALALLLALRRRVLARGGRLQWHGASRRLQDLAALYGVDGMLAVESTTPGQ